MSCEKCGKYHDGSYGSGRFCSRKCANSRTHTEETKNKIKNKLLGRQKSFTVYICEKCGDHFVEQYRIRTKRGKRIHCKTCRKKHNSVCIATSLSELSKRTISKILKRADKGCSICGWKEARCDIHHIISKIKGGTDDAENLIIVCPNHHRIIHSNKSIYSIDYLESLSIANTFSNWKSYVKLRR